MSVLLKKICGFLGSNRGPPFLELSVLTYTAYTYHLTAFQIIFGLSFLGPTLQSSWFRDLHKII